MRLDHLIAKRLQISKRQARTRIVSGGVCVGETPCTDLHRAVSRFDEVTSGKEVIQPGLERLYLKLNKPVGVVSATMDDEHETVLDLIDHPDKNTLHLAGRLDRSSSGLILLSNDSAWSESLTHPDSKVEKVYLVETDRSIPASAVERFAQGFHFESENVTTRPAVLELLTPTSARVILQEGRWHQIKRMFHRLDGIKLKSLHRERIGTYELGDLSVGEWVRIDSGAD